MLGSCIRRRSSLARYSTLFRVGVRNRGLREFSSDIYQDFPSNVDEGSSGTYRDVSKNMDLFNSSDFIAPHEQPYLDKYGELFRRQLRYEEMQRSDALNQYSNLMDEMNTLGKTTNLKFMQRILLKWYEPLCKEIEAEMVLITEGAPGKYRRQYGPYLFLLPVDKIALITLNCCINAVTQIGNAGFNISQLSANIANLIEMEVNIQKLKASSSSLPSWQRLIVERIQNGMSAHEARKTIRRLQSVFENEEWGLPIKLKLGVFLIELLINSARTDLGYAAFYHRVIFSHSKKKNVGVFKMSDKLYEDIVQRDGRAVEIRYLPMLVPPRSWSSRNISGAGSCYFRLQASLMRTTSTFHLDILRRAKFPEALSSLDYLGQLPWRFFEPIYHVIKEAYERKLELGEIPSQHEVPAPVEDDYLMSVKSKGDDGEEFETKIVDVRTFGSMRRRVFLKNAELHALRCELNIRLDIVERFLNDVVYFPCNMDFRGRVYPVPPNLSHLGSDLCRSLLRFAESKPLGEKGFFWLRVHIANLCGVNKISFEDRAAWVDQHMEDIRDSVRSPLDGKMWWTTADEPFQALSACMELVAAIDSGNPYTFESNLPIHQDGSCNGLQHYAALGRDYLGGKAVNLVQSDRPQDVYTQVLFVVKSKLDKWSEQSTEGNDEPTIKRILMARDLKDVVSRKVIKQTVMTSVYGVTVIGAREQIKNRLEEIFFSDRKAVISPDDEHRLFEYSIFLSKLTLESLSELFSGAKNIMEWLGICAVICASQGQPMSWVSPLGVPIIQPYRKNNMYVIRTALQSLTLTVDDDRLPVSVRKQRTAFPPNFVHSLDATHMLMTCHKMKELGLAFTAVHDSYWTHACDIDIMSKILRECFVELYSKPILNDLRDSIVNRYPGIDFPEIPARGDLDIREVLSSPYFFH